MSKEPKYKIVPKLRFPEFKDAGEWKEKTLGMVCSNISSGKDKTDINGEYDLFGSTGIIGKTSSAPYFGKFILVARVGANAGFLNKVYGKFGVTDNTLVMFLNEESGIDFIYYQLDKFGLNSLVFGSGQPLITGGQLKNLKIYLPKPPEQQKIASCLSSLDELIAAENQKLERLKTHKKGLMQQLFPAEGETVPKLRFAEFRDSEEWEEKSLGEICEVITKGTTPHGFSETGIRFIKIEAFEENYIVPGKCAFINEDTHNKELKRSILKENDILFAIAGATIGKVNIVTKDLLPANTNQALAIVRLKEKENKKFVLYILKSELMQGYIKKSISVGAQPNLNLEQMGSFSFAYPKNSKEHQKIASCLSSLDELIAAQSQKTEALKTHKKGLMQGLFPDINPSNSRGLENVSNSTPLNPSNSMD